MDNREIHKRLYTFSTFDGYLDKRYEGGNSRLSVTMLRENRDYIDTVAATLDAAGIGYRVWEPALNRHDGCNRRQQVRVQSKAHPILTKIRNRVYVEGKKVIDPHMLTMMDGEMLAIIFMADGSKKDVILTDGSNSPTYRIHTNGFSYGDNYLIANAVKDVFGFPLDVEQQVGTRWGLRVPKRFNEMFELSIKPFILPSFLYKIRTTSPADGG